MSLAGPWIHGLLHPALDLSMVTPSLHQFHSIHHPIPSLHAGTAEARGTPQSEDTPCPAHASLAPWAGLVAHKGRQKSSKIILDAVTSPCRVLGSPAATSLESSVWEPRGTVSAVNQSPLVQVAKVSLHDPEVFSVCIPHRPTHPQVQCSLSLGVNLCQSGQMDFRNNFVITFTITRKGARGHAGACLYKSAPAEVSPQWVCSK